MDLERRVLDLYFGLVLAELYEIRCGEMGEFIRLLNLHLSHPFAGLRGGSNLEERLRMGPTRKGGEKLAVGWSDEEG